MQEPSPTSTITPGPEKNAFDTQLEAQLSSQGRKRRPFQTRRKERSCDSCKVRKTKCNARDDKPCSACLAAKLPCTFSSPDHEGRKIGPTRRIRELERTVEELTKRLQLAEQRQRNGYRPQNDMATQESRHGTMASPLISGSYSDTTSSNPLRIDTGIPPTITEYPGPGPLTLIGFIGESDSGIQPGLSPVYSYDRGQYDWNYADSQFIDSYKEYLQRHGLYAQHISGESGNMYENSEPVPLLSDYAPSRARPEVDLRFHLPARTLSNRVLEVFRVNVQNFKPIFYWPILERKFERAYSSPMWENDGRVVNEVFCVVMIVLAVGSQLVKVENYFPLGSNSTKISQERHGWRFFELSRRYLNLNNPVYTLEDATVLLLMSLYLDNATLPSPCWMICGAMARVCQDIGLHRQPPSGHFTNVQLESRARLFWVAYVQDKRVSMKMRRPCIFRQEDCDILYPGAVDSTGIGTALLCPQVGDVLAGALRDESPEVKQHKLVAQRALRIMQATINACKTIEVILAHTFLPSESTEQHIRELQNFDKSLEECWDTLPIELRDTQNNKPLDLPAVRVLFVTQHARLILFRYFTNSSPSRTLTSALRNFCLKESIRVSLVTTRVLYRAQIHPDFNDQFGVVTDDLVRLHTFRVAVVLLLGLHLPNSVVRQSDLSICIVALQAIARTHNTGRQFLQLFKQFAGLFDNPFAHTHIPEEHATGISQPQSGAPTEPAPEWANTPYSDGMSYSAPITEPLQTVPSLIHDPHPHEAFAPQILSRIGAGDWSSFPDILQWDREFEAYLSGGSEWQF